MSHNNTTSSNLSSNLSMNPSNNPYLSEREQVYQLIKQKEQELQELKKSSSLVEIKILKHISQTLPNYIKQILENKLMSNDMFFKATTPEYFESGILEICGYGTSIVSYGDTTDKLVVTPHHTGCEEFDYSLGYGVGDVNFWGDYENNIKAQEKYINTLIEFAKFMMSTGCVKNIEYCLIEGSNEETLNVIKLAYDEVNTLNDLVDNLLEDYNNIKVVLFLYGLTTEKIKIMLNL